MDLITRKLTLDQVQLPDWAKKVAEDSKINSFVRKGLDVQDLKFVDGERAAIHIITNGNEVDRDGELVVPSGISFKNYERAGKPVCFAHSYHDLPCGACMWLRYSKADNAIIAKMRFASHQKANDIYEYAKEFGIACSIGFIPYDVLERDMYDDFDFKSVNIDPKVAQKARRTYLTSELLEYSLTPIQSHPGAVQIAVSKGFATDNELKSLGYVYEIIDKESQNAIQEEIIQEEIKAQDSGTISPTQEKEVEDSFIEFTDTKSEDNFCNCEESEYDNDTCKACGGKRKPKKEAKAPQCQCTECEYSCAPEDGKCDMNCPECGASMSMGSDDSDEDDIEQDACKPKKPKKDINVTNIEELGYTISDEEVENLVQQFEKMLDEQQDIYFEFDVDVNKKYLFEDCMLKIKQPTEEQIKNKDFDIASQPSIPSSKVLEIFCKFLGCRVKNIYKSDFLIPWTLSGSYLAGFKAICSQFVYKDTRNYNSYGTEYPPTYEVIKINSKTEDDFLVEGADFYSVNGKPIVCSFWQGREGIYTSIYSSRTDKNINKSVISSVHKWVEEKNPLKGEKFSLNKEFFDIDDSDNWDTLIADSSIEKSMKSAEKLIKEKEFNGRGILMLGPPGTGKTKCSRILMTQCKNQTFIWVSSKDLTKTWYPEEKIALGFKLARSLAPSILLLEDIDNWIDGKITDMMKTELDGLKKNKNVITILTTNNPEKLPNTLIDRPGRFHDVLNFDHPSKSVRERMLKEWLNIENEDLITQTEGFSGAYMWELIEFAKSIAEDENITIEEALVQSLEKINSQKELIRNIKKETKSIESAGPISIEELEDASNRHNDSFIEIEIKSQEQEEYEFDFNKALSIVEKSLDKVINTKYIDVDDLVYESLMKAKGKMFY